ncbi:zinc-binding dehydrogenase [Candidatus Poribacteria bacterium]|nr:zinc-binding dehydrogenase [Candidatus Poribacteria bacterium]
MEYRVPEYIMTIKQIVFPKQNKVVCQETEADFSLGVNDIAIKTHYSLVSAGTELAKLTGLQKVKYPFIPGNRAVGEVIETGAGVKKFDVGDMIFTHSPHVSHAKATKFCARISDNIDLCYASLVGLGLVAMTAIRVGQPELGDKVVITGMGVVGNLCAQLLNASGVDVIGVDVIQSRLDLAKKCGIMNIINPRTQDIRSAVMDLTDGHGAEYVIEATGNPPIIETACAVVAKQGQIILLGSPRGEYQTDVTPLLNSVHLWKDQGSIQLKGAHEWRYPMYDNGYAKHSMIRNADIFFRMLAQEKINVGDIITHIVEPQQAEEAFFGLLNNKDKYLGVVFDWTNQEQ